MTATNMCSNFVGFRYTPLSYSKSDSTVSRRIQIVRGESLRPSSPTPCKNATENARNFFHG